MKVLDMQLYRIKKERKRLEQRVSELALHGSQVGTVREIKSCVKTLLNFR